MLGQEHAIFNPDLRKIRSGLETPSYLGHVGAMLGLCGTYVGPMLVHVGPLGPMLWACWGFFFEAMSSLCWAKNAPFSTQT